jgi:hypothetical protein
MDRDYWSAETAAKIDDSGNKFLMRLTKKSSVFVSKSHDESGYFYTAYNGKKYKFRYFKFFLPSGEEEILAANLSCEEVPDNELGELYFMRWGVECKYRELKCNLVIEDFTGRSKLIALQDFYAACYLCNLTSFACKASDDIIYEDNKNKSLKYKYKTNRSLAISSLKDNFIKAIICNNPFKRKYLLNKIIFELSENRTPIREDRKYERDKTALKNKPHYKNKGFLQ